MSTVETAFSRSVDRLTDLLEFSKAGRRTIGWDSPRPTTLSANYLLRQEILREMKFLKFCVEELDEKERCTSLVSADNSSRRAAAATHHHLHYQWYDG